jgi:hypothetical protein
MILCHQLPCLLHVERGTATDDGTLERGTATDSALAQDDAVT